MLKGVSKTAILVWQKGERGQIHMMSFINLSQRKGLLTYFLSLEFGTGKKKRFDWPREARFWKISGSRMISAVQLVKNCHCCCCWFHCCCCCCCLTWMRGLQLVHLLQLDWVCRDCHSLHFQGSIELKIWELKKIRTSNFKLLVYSLVKYCTTYIALKMLCFIYKTL